MVYYKNSKWYILMPKWEIFRETIIMQKFRQNDLPIDKTNLQIDDFFREYVNIVDLTEFLK